ncbi:MAG: hypothetical protein LUC93_16275, partial [Planctomycetaceae bacterium]|nr:hypothetical protein [Planctomycetaceae bacterium]
NGYLADRQIRRLVCFGSLLNLFWAIPMVGTYLAQPPMKGFLKSAILSNNPSYAFVDKLNYNGREITDTLVNEINSGKISQLSIINYPFLSKFYGRHYTNKVSVIRAFSFTDFRNQSAQAQNILYIPPTPSHHLQPHIASFFSDGRLTLSVNLLSGCFFPFVAVKISSAPFQIDQGDRVFVDVSYTNSEDIRAFWYTSEEAEPILLKSGFQEIQEKRKAEHDRMYIGLELLCRSSQFGVKEMKNLAISIYKADGTVQNLTFSEKVEQSNLYDVWMHSVIEELKLAVKMGDSHAVIYER